MAVEVGTAYITVLPSAKGFAGALTGQISGPAAAAGATGGKQAGKGFVSNFRGAIKGLAAIAVGRAVFGFLKDSVNAASDLNETMNKSAVIFGDQSGAMEKWSKNAATSLGLSKAEALEAAAGFGNMFTQLGFTGNQAADMSQNVVKLSADLGSFNNLPTAEVADMISAAFRGEYDSLQRLIPNINAARVEQEAMAMSGKANAKELTAQEKAAAVMAIVTKDGAAALDDFAKTSDGAANQQKILQAQWQDMQATLGQALLPILTQVGGFLVSTVVPALASLADWIAQNVDWLGPLAGSLIAAAAAFKILNAVMQANIFAKIISLVILVAGIIIANWSHIKEFLVNLWNEIARIAGVVWEWIKRNIWQPIVDVWNFLVSTWNSIWSFLVTLWNGIVQIALTVWGWIKTYIITPIQTVWDWLVIAWNTVSTFLGTVWGGIESTAKTVWGFIKDYIINPIKEAWDWLVNTWKGIARFLTDVWDGISKVADDIWWGIVDTIKRVINFFIDVINKFIEGYNFFAEPFLILGLDLTIDPIERLPVGKTGRAATGGYITGPGTGTSDSIPVLLSNGEYVINAASTRKFLPLLQALNAGQWPRFALGGQIGASQGEKIKATATEKLDAEVESRAGGVFSFVQKLVNEKLGPELGAQALVKAGLGGGGGQGVGQGSWQGASGPAHVGTWVRAAMDRTGVPANWHGPLVSLAMHESGGNPNAINLWDSNAAAGIPSKGLFQTIDPTFAAYSLGGSIYDPVANAIAAIRYILARYGSIFSIASYTPSGFVGGYRYGGMVDRTGYGYLHAGERVLSPEENRGMGTQYNVTVNAAPTVPTEDEIARVLRNVDYLYGR